MEMLKFPDLQKVLNESYTLEEAWSGYIDFLRENPSIQTSLYANKLQELLNMLSDNKLRELEQEFHEVKKQIVLLSQKYGNAQQFYTDMNNPEENATTQPDQNPNLLHDLELGDADLYATFEGDNVGVALGVNVDGDMQSYLLIDYKNLKILKENEVKLLNSL